MKPHLESILEHSALKVRTYLIVKTGCFQQTGIELARSFSKYRERAQGGACREREEWVEKMRGKRVMSSQNKLMISLVCHTGAEFCNKDSFIFVSIYINCSFIRCKFRNIFIYTCVCLHLDFCGLEAQRNRESVC